MFIEYNSVPAGEISAQVSVRLLEQTSSTVTFTYLPPSIASVSPSSQQTQGNLVYKTNVDYHYDKCILNTI